MTAENRRYMVLKNKDRATLFEVEEFDVNGLPDVLGLLDDEDLFDIEEDYLTVSDEISSADLCRYGCGREAVESFGVCNGPECVAAFDAVYPEARLGR